MLKPLISICIPTFNGEKYLRECLDSCISQSFKDYEVVICDDGSTDTTLQILETYKGRFEAMQVYRNDKNLGLVNNWNKCIELAAGSWIKFLFQDDVMEQNCLQRFYENIQIDSELLVCKRHFILDKATSAEEEVYYTEGVRTLENTGHYHSQHFSPQTLSNIAAQNISLNFIAEPSLILFKKQVVDSLGYFDKELRQICDLEFCLRIGSNSGLYYIPEQLCRFRIHAHSTTERNIRGKHYWANHLEALVYATKLLVKPEFENLRKSIPTLARLKIKLYVKYKSYIAFKAIRSKEDAAQYAALKRKYPGRFFKKYDTVYLILLALIKS